MDGRGCGRRSLDGGPVLAQELFPLELAPEDDPVAYLRRLQSETLIPHGVRMMAAVVTGPTAGPVTERVQPAGSGRPRRAAAESAGAMPLRLTYRPAHP